MSPRPRHVLAAAGVALVATLGVVGTATAQTTPPPKPLTCAEATTAEGTARTAFEASLPALLEFAPNVYPGDKVPALGALPGLLDDILADPDLGGGARTLVDAAAKLQTGVAAAVKARQTACTPPAPTTTPKPPTTTRPPTTTPAPPTTTTAPPAGGDEVLPADNDPADQFIYRPNTTQGIATGGR